jgi:catechol 2,3-dioxygenase-like lactoylglutathione lyase family enzyme
MRRRTFIQLGVPAALGPPIFFSAHQEKSDMPLVDQVPPMLDHILLGCNDLQRGIAFVEQHTGVRAAFGGVHPGRGTQNALLSLGPSRYLEIIAPDPQQHTENPLAKELQSLAEPRLVGWAAHLRNNIASFASKLKQAGVEATGPTPGSRKRPDGSELHWQTLNPKDDATGLLPFFIQWAGGSEHPSADAPSGCQLLRFELLTPDPAALAKLTARLALEAPIAKAPTPQLRAVIKGPKGQLSVTS